jgi:hypothetical protein
MVASPADGVKLTELRKDQADYIGVKQEGPFAPLATRLVRRRNTLRRAKRRCWRLQT